MSVQVVNAEFPQESREQVYGTLRGPAGYKPHQGRLIKITLLVSEDEIPSIIGRMNHMMNPKDHPNSKIPECLLWCGCEDCRKFRLVSEIMGS